MRATTGYERVFGVRRPSIVATGLVRPVPRGTTSNFGGGKQLVFAFLILAALGPGQALSQPASKGVWHAEREMPHETVHLLVLPDGDGNVLSLWSTEAGGERFTLTDLDGSPAWIYQNGPDALLLNINYDADPDGTGYVTFQASSDLLMNDIVAGVPGDPGHPGDEYNFFCGGIAHGGDHRIFCFGGTADDGNDGTCETSSCIDGHNLVGYFDCTYPQTPPEGNAYWFTRASMVSGGSAVDRWYPTPTTLADGRFLVPGGDTNDPDSGLAKKPGVYDPTNNSWTLWTSDWPGANLGVLQYPFAFVRHPSGDVFMAGNPFTSYRVTWSIATGSQTWTPVPNQSACHEAVSRFHGAGAVTYCDYDTDGTLGWRQWVLKTGGNTFEVTGSPTCFRPYGGDRVERIELTAASPAWALMDSNHVQTAPREFANLLLLPTGHVINIGGSRPRLPGDCQDPYDPDCYTYDVKDRDLCPDVLEAEWAYLFPLPPLSDQPDWGDGLAAMASRHAYHSGAVLLRDGRVMVAGGNHHEASDEEDCCSDVCFDRVWSDGRCFVRNKHYQVYSPPYLYKANGDPVTVRPRLSNETTPATAYYEFTYFTLTLAGTDFSNEDIKEISLVRLGAITHSFDANTRYIRLKKQASGTSPGEGRFVALESDPSKLRVNPPPDTIAPPGYYMLFVLVNGDNGLIPSRGRMLFLRHFAES